MKTFRYPLVIQILLIVVLSPLHAASEYGPNSGFKPSSETSLPSVEMRNKHMASLLSDASANTERVISLIPDIPVKKGAYYLNDGSWKEILPYPFHFKQSFSDRLNGSGRLVAGAAIGFAQIEFKNPIFLFHQTRMDDPPCVVGLSNKDDEVIIPMEKVTQAGAWVKRTRWSKVRLSKLPANWYVLELRDNLPPGEYALCHHLTVIPFKVSDNARRRPQFEVEVADSSDAKTSRPKEDVQQKMAVSPIKSRYADLKIPESCFKYETGMKPIDKKNGFQEINLGTPPAPKGSTLVKLPNIGAENFARKYRPEMEIFQGSTSVRYDRGQYTPGSEVMSTEYFMGGLGRSSHSNINAWVEAVAEPDAKPLFSRPKTVKIFPNDVEVYSLNGTRQIGDIEVGHIGLNYIGSRLAGIVMQYDLEDETKLISIYRSAFGKGAQMQNGHYWTGDLVRIEVAEGYIRYSSIPVLQVIAGFLPTEDTMSQDQALNEL